MLQQETVAARIDRIPLAVARLDLNVLHHLDAMRKCLLGKDQTEATINPTTHSAAALDRLARLKSLPAWAIPLMMLITRSGKFELAISKMPGQAHIIDDTFNYVLGSLAYHHAEFSRHYRRAIEQLETTRTIKVPDLQFAFIYALALTIKAIVQTEAAPLSNIREWICPTDAPNDKLAANAALEYLLMEMVLSVFKTPTPEARAVRMAITGNGLPCRALLGDSLGRTELLGRSYAFANPDADPVLLNVPTLIGGYGIAIPGLPNVPVPARAGVTVSQWNTPLAEGTDLRHLIACLHLGAAQGLAHRVQRGHHSPDANRPLPQQAERQLKLATAAKGSINYFAPWIRAMLVPKRQPEHLRSLVMAYAEVAKLSTATPTVAVHRLSIAQQILASLNPDEPSGQQRYFHWLLHQALDIYAIVTKMDHADPSQGDWQTRWLRAHALCEGYFSQHRRLLEHPEGGPGGGTQIPYTAVGNSRTLVRNFNLASATIPQPPIPPSEPAYEDPTPHRGAQVIQMPAPRRKRKKKAAGT